MKPGRVPCINPRCRRTAPFDADVPEQEIICRGCWRGVPVAFRNRVRNLERRDRGILRAVEKRVARGTIDPKRVFFLQYRSVSLQNAAWARIKNYFREPVHPFGLDAVLEELNLLATKVRDGTFA